jgi:HK97 family phage prohead protease
MEKAFVLNDERKENSYGFKVLNSGGRFDRFKDNPVMLHDHDTGKLIGRWDNLKVDGHRLTAEPVFDLEDASSKEIKGKVERGFLKGCSMGIRILNAARVEHEGKEIPAVTDWELMEASITAIPSNGMSLRLYSDQGELLSTGAEVQLSLDKFINKNPMEKQTISITKEAATVLGLSSPELTDGQALSAAVVSLSARAEKAEGDLNTYLKARAAALVDTAIKEGRLTADKKEAFLKMAESDYKQAADIISALPPKQSMSGRVRELNGTAGTADREDWNYLRWAKEDPAGLAKMKGENPERFEQLRAAYKPAN